MQVVNSGEPQPKSPLRHKPSQQELRDVPWWPPGFLQVSLYQRVFGRVFLRWERAEEEEEVRKSA